MWYVARPNIILTLPNGENRQYKVKDDYKFIVDGQKASVYDLRKGMVVKAEKIVEAPLVELTQHVAVTGSALPPPAPKTEVAQAIPLLLQPPLRAKSRRRTGHRPRLQLPLRLRPPNRCLLRRSRPRRPARYR